MLSVARRSTPRIIRPLVQCYRLNSTVAATSATAGDGIVSTTPVDPKIATIVDSISQLTILETSQLITELKSKLNIPDIAPMAPMAAMGNAGAVGGADGAAAEEAPKEEEKTTFSVKLESFDAKSKAKIIKEIKSVLGLSLVEAKKFVEGAPKVIKDNISKADADALKDTLEKLGGKISLE